MKHFFFKGGMMGEGIPRNNNRPLVCIVADDISIRESLSSLLRSAALNVKIFSSTEDFLSDAPFEAVGCLIVDVQLPGTTDLDLQQELVTREIEIPIIFLTGYDDTPIEAGAAKPGAVECLTKPLDDDCLLETVWSAVRSYMTSRKLPEGNSENGFGRFSETKRASNALPHQP